MKVSDFKLKRTIVWGKISSIFSYFFIPLILAGIIASDDNEDYIILFSLIVIFVLLTLNGSRLKKRVARVRKYTALIFGKRIYSLGEIAASMLKSVDFVANDLHVLIVKGYFVDMEIDMAANKVIEGSKSAAARAAKLAELEKYEKYDCPGCGASGTKLKGEYKHCDYCGSAV